jgi:hypothetical protein
MNLNDIHGINLDESTYSPICFIRQGKNSTHKSNFITGDIVYAQYKSFAWWPGRVATPAEINWNIHESIDKTHYLIYFFGSYSYGWVAEKKLIKYEIGLTNQQKKLKKSQRSSKSFKLAEQEAAQFINGERVMIVTSLLWVQSWPTVEQVQNKKNKNNKRSRENFSESKKIESRVNHSKKQKQKSAADTNSNSTNNVLSNREDALCFVCLTGGSLLCCDVPSCPRVYHFGCLHLRRPPPDNEPFICPWHFCSNCGERDRLYLGGAGQLKVRLNDDEFDSFLLKRPSRYVYNPFARFDQTENYRGKVNHINFISNIIVNNGNINRNTSKGHSTDNNNENITSIVNRSNTNVEEAGSIPSNKKIHFWYSTLSPCSFCPKCIDSQTMCDLLHITEIGENLFNKTVQFFVPGIFQKSLPITRLNLIFERVLYFVFSNSLSQPFLQPLILALPKRDRGEFSKLLGELDGNCSDLSYICEKVRFCKYRSVKQYLNDWNLIQKKCAILCNGKYAASAVSLQEALKTIFRICKGQLDAHAKEIQLLESDISDNNINNEQLKNNILRSKICFPVLTTGNCYDGCTKTFIPSYENGWTIEKWNKYVEKGENCNGLPLHLPSTEDSVVVHFKENIDTTASSSSSSPVAATIATSTTTKTLAKTQEMENKIQPNSQNIISTTVIPNEIQTDEEINIANVLNNINDIIDERDVKDVVKMNDSPTDFDVTSAIEGNSLNSKFQLLPDPVEKIRLLVERQAHHMRSALLASKELQSAWFATSQMYSSGGSSSNTILDGNNSIISIGDGNLIAEYRLANRNLKVMITKLRQELRAETIRRMEIETELLKLKKVQSTSH